MNPKTRKRVRETCFKPLDLDISLFDQLLNEYKEEYFLADLRFIALKNRVDSAFPLHGSYDIDDDTDDEDSFADDSEVSI